MDEARPQAEAVAITGGRITAVGSTADLLALKGPQTEVIDLHGATVIPGLKESHGHFVGIGQARMSLNLVGTKSWDEVVARVAAAVKGRPKGAWIVGRGWHEGKWETKPAQEAHSRFPAPRRSLRGLARQSRLSDPRGRARRASRTPRPWPS